MDGAFEAGVACLLLFLGYCAFKILAEKTVSSPETYMKYEMLAFVCICGFVFTFVVGGLLILQNNIT